MNKFVKIVLLFLPLFIGIIALLFLFFNGKPLCKNCNVILISIDTLGSKHLPCYGYKRNTAPNLCKFAKENIYFTQAFSNASWTLPSHFSIFTGLYPKHHGMEDYGKKLDENISTLTQTLVQNGYDTMFVGPTKDITLPLDKGLERGFKKIENYKNLASWKKGFQKLSTNSKSGKKTFLFLHSYWVHAPYMVNDLGGKNKKRIYANKIIPPIPLDYEESFNFSSDYYNFLIDMYGERAEKESETEKWNTKLDLLQNSSDLNQAKEIYFSTFPYHEVLEDNYIYYYNLVKKYHAEDYAKDLYDELIYYLDKELAGIFSLLTDKTIANNTIVIITADHGEEFMEHGVIFHPSDHLYNTVTGVPLILYLPGYAGKKIDQLVESVDILPTVLNLVGIKSPDNLDGIALTSLIENSLFKQSKRYHISQGKNIDAIRDERWKLYVNYQGLDSKTFKLYALEKDPEEQSNLSLQHPDIISYLEKNLNLLLYK